MREYIYIQNFGPLKKVEIKDIKPFTVLIGESGSGKSTLMKVISLFRWMYKRANLRSYVQHAKIARTGIGFKIQSLMKTSGIIDFLKDDSVIIYKRGDYEIKMQHKSTNIRFKVAPEDLSLEKICFISDKRSIIPDLLQNHIDNRCSSYHLLDTIDNFKTAIRNIEVFNMDYLGVKLKVTQSKATGAKLRIEALNNKQYDIDINSASSGMQSATPLGLIIENYSNHFKPEEVMNSSLLKLMADTDNLKSFSPTLNVGEIKNRFVHIMVEEPELSLYPNSQIRLVDFMVSSCFNRERDYKMTLMLATHSPYIVNYLNVLIKRYGQRMDEANISPEDIAVYYVNSDGGIDDLKGEDLATGETVIDTIQLSEQMQEIFDNYSSLAQ